MLDFSILLIIDCGTGVFSQHCHAALNGFQDNCTYFINIVSVDDEFMLSAGVRYDAVYIISVSVGFGFDKRSVIQREGQQAVRELVGPGQFRLV